MRYPGGKYKLAKWIISHFPQHNLYVEPFGGAGSVLMRKAVVQGEIFNDVDGDVVNVFRVLRDRAAAAELERVLRLTPFAYEEYKRAYEPCEDPIERARRTIFRSFSTIGSYGVSRRNSGFRGLKNNDTFVTAAQEWSRYPNAIQAFVERLQNVLIEHRDAFHLLNMYDRINTLFYVDPPYVLSARSNQAVLYTNEMTDVDHIRLSEVLHSREGMVILSGYPSGFYDRLYGDWKMISRSSRAGNGTRRTECIWLSPNIRTTLF